MTPTLIAIAGALSGARIPLGEQELRVGSDDDNRVTLTDPAVSPRHCVFTVTQGKVAIRDLDPANPTFINGLPAADQTLSEGDHIQIGTSVFVIRYEETSSEPAVTLGDEAASVPIMVVRREEALAARADRETSPERAARDLAALVRISSALTAVRGLAALERPLIEMIAEAIPADRAALVFGRDVGSAATSIVGWTPGAMTAGPVRVSRPVIDRVLGDVAGVLASGAAGDSSSAARGPWTVAAPLVAFDKVLGAIVLERDPDNAAFDSGHLRLLMAISAVVATALEYARQVEWLEGENRRLQGQLDVGRNMVGNSVAMRDVYRRVARVAETDSTVLITGESGTGKELVARAIHGHSARSTHPFVAINCAAITETLLESELFGHEKGAFTGAIAQKKGKLEVAEGGTVFLDEIGELPGTLQAKLLRVLQEREFERVGGTRRVQVDFRLIAATNRDLQEAIRAGGFRRDLFYRLDVVSLAMPPLRERREDIPLLASYFARRHGEKAKRRVAGFSSEALACLTAYDWPGNVRELENAVERAIVLGSTATIVRDDLPEAIAEASTSRTSVRATGAAGSIGFHDAVTQAKRDIIMSAVDQGNGNLTAAARELGLHPNYLHRLITQLQLRSLIKNSTEQ